MMLPSHSTDARKRKELTDRQNWCEMAYRMAEPVLRNMSEGKLQEEMPAEVSPKHRKPLSGILHIPPAGTSGRRSFLDRRSASLDVQESMGRRKSPQRPCRDLHMSQP